MPNILYVVHQFFVLPFFIGEQFQYFDTKGYELHVICSQSPQFPDYSKKMKFSYPVISYYYTQAFLSIVLMSFYNSIKFKN